MKRLETQNPDVLAWRGGGGCLTLFGLPFLLAGLAAILLPLAPFDVAIRGPLWLMPVFGAVFALAGAVIAFGRRHLTIDRARGEIVSRWRVLAVLGGKQRRLDEFDHVSLTREVRRTKDSTYTVFPVRLAPPGDGRSGAMAIREATAYAKSRALAEEIAKFIDKPLVDATSGRPVRRDPQTLDESIREQVRRTGEPLTVRPPPAQLATDVALEPGRATLRIPPTGFRALHIVLVFAGLAIPSIVILIMAVSGALSRIPAAAWLAIIPFGALPCVVLVAIATAMARRSWVVTVSPQAVTVETQGLLSRAKTLTSDDIEELDVFKPTAKLANSLTGGIQIRTDRETVTFGGHLPRAELEYLHGVIRLVIASG